VTLGYIQVGVLELWMGVLGCGVLGVINFGIDRQKRLVKIDVPKNTEF
jgi:hypothetical protein